MDKKKEISTYEIKIYTVEDIKQLLWKVSENIDIAETNNELLSIRDTIKVINSKINRKIKKE